MTATQSEPKTRATKAIAVSKLIGGKLVHTLAKSELDKLHRARQLCIDLDDITAWQNETRQAAEALTALLAKCGRG